MDMESPAFENHQTIPKKFTCEGENISPELRIKKVPAGTKSLVIIVDDPDAPHGVFVHWVAWNIDPATSKLEEGVTLKFQGKNHYGEIGYKGPCPPLGERHRYFFKLYALDIELNLPIGSNKEQLLETIQGHILGKTELIGLYQR